MNTVNHRDAKLLNKFYTEPSVARSCVQYLTPFLFDDTLLIEPSAGGGAFMQAAAPDRDIRGVDIAPDPDGYPGIRQHDFLTSDVRDLLSAKDRRRHVAFIGNPPFGHKGKTALAFLNRALSSGKLAAFILPVGFRKWSVQSRITPGAKLIADHDLAEDSFSFCGKPYSIRCCFQIWTTTDRGHQDLRITAKPPKKHQDFWLGQYNRTEAAAHVFDHSYDFAVRRQGPGSYEPIFPGNELDRRWHWMLVEAKSEDVLRRLVAIDFAALARGNALLPGFGKADVVAAYERLLAGDRAHQTLQDTWTTAANSNSTCDAAAA